MSAGQSRFTAFGEDQRYRFDAASRRVLVLSSHRGKTRPSSTERGTMTFARSCARSRTAIRCADTPSPTTGTRVAGRGRWTWRSLVQVREICRPIRPAYLSRLPRVVGACDLATPSSVTSANCPSPHVREQSQSIRHHGCMASKGVVLPYGLRQELRASSGIQGGKRPFTPAPDLSVHGHGVPVFGTVPADPVLAV